MKHKILLYLVVAFILISFALFLGCTKSTEPEPEPEEENNYTAMSSNGDVIRFDIDAENGTYSYVNETAGQSGNGTFTISNDPNLTGVYVTSDDHFIIEIPDELFITSLPLGRPENDIVFGLTSERNLSNETLTGDYIYVLYGEEGVEGGGGYRINADGTYTWEECPDPDSITSPFDYFEGDGSGTWTVDPQDSSRIIATEEGVDYYGTIFPGKIMMFNNGPGAGFTLGLKYPSSPVSLSQIAGTYRCIDILVETGEYGVGYYTLPSSSAPVSYYIEYSGSSGTVSGTTSGNVSRHPYTNNLFQFDDAGEYDMTVYLLLLPGEVMIHFCFDNDTGIMISSGIGAKIN